MNLKKFSVSSADVPAKLKLGVAMPAGIQGDFCRDCGVFRRRDVDAGVPETLLFPGVVFRLGAKRESGVVVFLIAAFGVETVEDDLTVELPGAAMLAVLLTLGLTRRSPPSLGSEGRREALVTEVIILALDPAPKFQLIFLVEKTVGTNNCDLLVALLTGREVAGTSLAVVVFIRLEEGSFGTFGADLILAFAAGDAIAVLARFNDCAANISTLARLIADPGFLDTVVFPGFCGAFLSRSFDRDGMADLAAVAVLARETATAFDCAAVGRSFGKARALTDFPVV